MCPVFCVTRELFNAASVFSKLAVIDMDNMCCNGIWFYGESSVWLGFIFRDVLYSLVI